MPGGRHAVRITVMISWHQCALSHSRQQCDEGELPSVALIPCLACVIEHITRPYDEVPL